MTLFQTETSEVSILCALTSWLATGPSPGPSLPLPRFEERAIEPLKGLVNPGSGNEPLQRALLASTLVLLLAAAPATASVGQQTNLEDRSDERTQDPFEYCGEIRPVFKNPDLQPAEDGLVHATGWFFIQFQVIVEEDRDIDRLAFSFGKPIPEQLRTCDTPEWISDAYYKDYRVDDDPSDGFFIPINTTNVPDGEYAAAISVYEDGEEVGRGFTRAVVENGCPLGFSFCERETIQENDAVKPWPIVLPGDGEQIHGFDGLSIEFAEPVREDSVRAFVDGAQVPLEPMEPREWDEDSVFAPADEDAPACPACQDGAWGPAFKWQGQIPEGAVIKVRAEDLNNNTVTKILHLSSTTVGGVISVQLPELQVNIPDADKRGEPGETVEFEVELQNVGRDEAHTDLHLEATEGLHAQWETNHVVVGADEQEKLLLEARADEDGTYEINASAEYKQGAEDIHMDIPLTLTVGEGGSQAEDRNETTEDDNQSDEELNSTARGGDGSGDENGVPAPALGALTLTLGVAAAVAHRGRQRLRGP